MKVLRAAHLADPYPVYRELRDQHPVYCDNTSAEPIWMLSRHVDVSAALADWQAFSSVQGSTGYPANAFALRNREGGRQMIESDPPLHDELRETVKARYSPRGVRELEQRFRAAADALLATVEREASFDVAADFAWPLTMNVTSELVGIPAEDRTTVLGWYHDIIYSGVHDLARRSAIAYGDYFSALASERELRPRDDLMSDLVRLSTRGSITRPDAVLLCMDLFEGGVDVPANLIANAVSALAANPAQQALIADPDLEHTRRRVAIEELARFDTPIQYLPRVTTRDVELHSTTIPEGSRVRLLLAAANRDERQYPDPDVLDLSRPPSRSVAFGVGVHFCIGAPLARLGVGVALPTLLHSIAPYEVPAIPNRPAGADIMRAFLQLPVTLGSDGSRSASATGTTTAESTSLTQSGAESGQLAIVVDPDRCEGHGECALAAPGVFELDDDLRLSYDPSPNASRAAEVERAAARCPVQAIEQRTVSL